MDRARSSAGLLSLLLVVAVSGCSPGADATEPSPPPSSPVSQTPTETLQERQERQDYAAAEKSYRTFRAEYNRVLRAGGAQGPTKLMRHTAGGDYLATFDKVIRGFHNLGSRSKGREKIVYVRPGGHEPTAVALNVCEDDRDLTTLRRSRANGHGDLRNATLEVRRVRGQWKVWSGTGKVVTSCD